ncbi:MAG: hypothetical protein HYY06_27090 [Deltaproteobacteria bacterium]|nr:hypothetical protein [Deltaproteobacteria bacterium]
MSARSTLPLVAVLVLAPAGAGANPAVHATVEPLFSPGAVVYEGWTPFVTTVCAESRLTVSLELSVVPGWGSALGRTVRTVEVPADGCSKSITYLYLQGSGVRATVLGSEREKLAIARWRWEGVGRQFRLAVLGGLEVEDLALPSEPDVQVIRPSLFPDRAMGWMPADAVLAAPQEIERMRPEERQALFDWVEIGGRLLVADWGADALPDRPSCAFGVNQPSGGPELLCMGHLLDSTDSVERGLGRVVFLMGAPHERATRIEQALRERRGVAGLVWGPSAVESWTFLQAPARDVIDWNARRRPPVGLVAALLAAYVLLLGPAQYRWLSRRGRATLALATVPILSVAIFLAFVGMGWWLKGGTARYDSVALLEAGSGGTLAASRRYAGLFVTRPGSSRIRGAPGALIRDLVEPRPAAQHGRARIEARRAEAAMTLEGIPVGLWETVFVREDSLVTLGGGVRIERAPGHVGVVNQTPFTLREAMISTGSPGRRIRLGAIAPGESRKAPWTAGSYSRLPRGFWLVPAPEVVGTAVLLARLDPRALPAFAGFERGREHTLLRVVAP